MAKIMVQGTASSVGKSILVTALCRIFKQDGFNVVPYKSQNMSLNSYITMDGKEMGRAQVLQAYAAGMEPQAFMNPILLKPTGDKKCQIIVNGKVYGNSSAMEYHNMKLEFRDMLKRDFQKLEDEFDIVVMEGAGSPAEINLRDRDIVNMGMAELVDAPVILVGDIDKGGVFASIAGTLLLLSDDEKDRVKGTIINKFRGDVEILKPGLTMLEDIINKPTLGVVPHFRLMLEDEDGAVEFKKFKDKDIDVAVIKLPHISNFTDLDALCIEEDVSVRFVSRCKEFGEPDVVIIPGSKNTLEDLMFVKNSGLDELIIEHSKDKVTIGICGGFQILGKKLMDPYETESSVGEIDGLGLLDIDTIFEKEKTMTRVKANSGVYTGEMYGYEIHMGQCKYGSDAEALFHIYDENGEGVSIKDGAVNKRRNIMGTYIHGVFDGVDFRQQILNRIRKDKGLDLKNSPHYESVREQELDKLADLVREALDMDMIYEITGVKRG